MRGRTESFVQLAMQAVENGRKLVETAENVKSFLSEFSAGSEDLVIKHPATLAVKFLLSWQPPNATKAKRPVNRAAPISCPKDGSRHRILFILGDSALQSPRGRLGRVWDFKFNQASSLWKTTIKKCWDPETTIFLRQLLRLFSDHSETQLRRSAGINSVYKSAAA